MHEDAQVTKQILEFVERMEATERALDAAREACETARTLVTMGRTMNRVIARMTEIALEAGADYGEVLRTHEDMMAVFDELWDAATVD